MNTRETMNSRPACSNRRSAARGRVGLPARLETVTGLRPVILQNVSASGAMIEARDLPAVGKDVIIKCGNLDVLTIVILGWQRPLRLGLRRSS